MGLLQYTVSFHQLCTHLFLAEYGVLLDDTAGASSSASMYPVAPVWVQLCQVSGTSVCRTAPKQNTIYALYRTHPKPPERPGGVAPLTLKHIPIAKNVSMYGENVKDQCVILDFDNYIISNFTKMAFYLSELISWTPKTLF